MDVLEKMREMAKAGGGGGGGVQEKREQRVSNGNPLILSVITKDGRSD